MTSVGVARLATFMRAVSDRRPSLRGANGSRECAPDDRLRDEAIHSFSTRRDGLLRFARNDVAQISHITSRSRGADRPRFCWKRSRLREQRAQGMPGAQCTRSLACNVKWHTSVVTTVTPELTRHSPRNGFTAYAVLSPATSSCCHRHPRIKGSSNPVELDFASANLAPATGARTTRFYRTQKSADHPARRTSLTRFISPCDCRCAPDAFTSTASRPALVTTRDRPSGGTRQANQ
jgi:hypothetical protein